MNDNVSGGTVKFAKSAKTFAGCAIIEAHRRESDSRPSPQESSHAALGLALQIRYYLRQYCRYFTLRPLFEV